jgi:hypothetical protein
MWRIGGVGMAIDLAAASAARFFLVFCRRELSTDAFHAQWRRKIQDRT